MYHTAERRDNKFCPECGSRLRGGFWWMLALTLNAFGLTYFLAHLAGFIACRH
jgi:hypothetical protein